MTALAGAASTHTVLLRPPYSSTPDDLTRPESAAVNRAARLGYLVTLADRDGEDWRRPGIGRNRLRCSADKEPRGIERLREHRALPDVEQVPRRINRRGVGIDQAARVAVIEFGDVHTSDVRRTRHIEEEMTPVRQKRRAAMTEVTGAEHRRGLAAAAV